MQDGFRLPPARWPRVQLFEFTDLPGLPRPIRRFFRIAYQSNITGLSSMVAYNMILGIIPLATQFAIIRRLLDLGWTVHTTVRNLAREAELRRRLLVVMDERQPGGAARLKFFAADLTADAGWAEAVFGEPEIERL